MTFRKRAISPPATVAGNRARLRLRRRLLLLGLPVVLAATVAAGWLLSLSFTAGSALQEYNRGSFATSAETFGELLDPNLVEPWIAYFDRGAALAADTDFVPAIDDFEKALAVVPEAHKCEVVVNLSLGWEKLADGYAQAGLFAGAALLYQTALDVLEAYPCTAPANPVDGREPGQEIDEAQLRLEDKLGAADYLDGLDDSNGAATPEEQQEELQEQQDDAAQDKADDDAQGRANGGTGGFAEKPW